VHISAGSKKRHYTTTDSFNKYSSQATASANDGVVWELVTLQQHSLPYHKYSDAAGV